jgi:predicted component of type VI protein secretion system
VTTSKGFILNVYELDLTPVAECVSELPVRIGRSSLNDVCVAHRLVSEFHARVEAVDRKLCVRDLSSKNGVLVEAVGSDGAVRIAAQTPVDLEPYGFEFLLSPLLRVRVRPANGRALSSVRHSQALGSVLGNVVPNVGNGAFAGKASAIQADEASTAGFGAADQGALGSDGRGPSLDGAGRPTPLVPPGAPRRGSRPAPRPSSMPPQTQPVIGKSPVTGKADAPPSAANARPLDAARGRQGLHGTQGVHGEASPGGPPSASVAVQPYASVLIEPPPGSLALPPLPKLDAGALTPLEDDAPAPQTRVSHPSPARPSTLFESDAPLPVVPPLARTAWELGRGTLPAGSAQPSSPPPEPPSRSIEALALRGLRELAASLLPGQPVESAADVVRLITKLHDAMEMFCRCFIPVREAGSRFIPADELELAAAERCQHRSVSYVAIERALEPHAVAAALLDWRNDDHDAPRAVEHILADLMLHHLALSQAAIEGTKALLDELSPVQFDKQQPRTPSMLSRLGLPGARERALWERFVDRHAELAAAGDSFRELFGEHFSRAYAAHFPIPGSGPSL